MNASRTVFYWGFYVILAGVAVLAVPNLLFSVLGVPTTSDPWPRVVGALAIPLGLYYVVAGRAEEMAFVRATVVGRPLWFLGLLAIAAFGGLPWQIMLFGVVDLAGAAWTAFELARKHQGVLPFVARPAS
jgi:hypothetical protein